MRVTLTAVSVVICFGPSLLVAYPFWRSSDVRSRVSGYYYTSQVASEKKIELNIPLGGSSPRGLVDMLVYI